MNIEEKEHSGADAGAPHVRLKDHYLKTKDVRLSYENGVLQP
jgi:hypothetical protein